MAQKRIDYYGRFTPTGVDTSQAKRLQALSGLAEQVGDIAFEVGAKIQTERGQEAGVASGMEAAAEGQAPETKEGFLSQISIYDQAYNKAALNAYSSGVRVDGRKKLMELEEQFADEPDPEQFNRLWEGYVTGVTKGLPPEMAANLRLSLEDDGMRLGGRIADARRTLDFDKNVATVNEDIKMLGDGIAEAVYQGNETLAEKLKAELENTLAQNVQFIDPENATEIRNNLEDRLIIQGNLGQIDRFFDSEGTLRQKVQRARGFLQDFITKDSVDGITQEQKVKLENSMAQRISALEKNLAEDDTATGILISDFEVGIVDGKYSIEQVEDFTNEQLALGNITRDKRTSLLKLVRSTIDDNTEANQVAQKFAAELRGDGDPFFTPTTSETNNYYNDSYRPKFEGGTIEQRLLADYNFINQVRRVPVPDGIKMTVNGMLQSGDPKQVLAATRFLDRVDEIPGNKAEVVVSKQNRAFAGQLVQYMNAGIPGDEAYTLAQKYIREDAAERIAVRTEQIKKEFDEDISEWVEEATGLKPGDRGFADARKQYQVLFNAQYLEGAEVEVSKNFANRIISANYKESIFGPMMYPPEDYWADNNGSVDYIRRSIAYEVRRENPDMQFDEDKDIFLYSDDETARKASVGTPTYRVMIRDSNGELAIRSGRFDPSDEFIARRADETLANMLLTKEIREGEAPDAIERVRAQISESDDPATDIEELRRKAGAEVREIGAEAVMAIPGLLMEAAGETGAVVDVAARADPRIRALIEAPSAVKKAYDTLLNLQKETIAEIGEREKPELIAQVEGEE
jgi:hypothetical protein